MSLEPDQAPFAWRLVQPDSNAASREPARYLWAGCPHARPGA